DGDGLENYIVGDANGVHFFESELRGWSAMGSIAEGGVVQGHIRLADTGTDGRADLVMGTSDGFVVVGNRGPVAHPVVYCTAKPTSNGCLPAIHSTGTPSATATGGFVISASSVINNKTGLLLYSTTGRASIPFQGGSLCLASPLHRGPAQNSGGNPPPNDCSGPYPLAFNAFPPGLPAANPIP